MPTKWGSPAAVFIPDPPDVVYRGDNVHLTYRSGDYAFERVLARSTWRTFLEREIRKLNDEDRRVQGRVAPLRPPASRRPPKRANGGEGGNGADHAA